MMIDEQDKCCGNCEYWDFSHAIKLPRYTKGGEYDGHDSTLFAPCRKGAVDADVGNSYTLMAADAHCAPCYHDEFKPSEDFLYMEKEGASIERDMQVWDCNAYV